MRYQWISRLLGNELIDVDAVMAPYAREVLARLAADGRRVVLMIDQTRATERHQVVMVAARVGGRALPLAWRGKATEGAIGFPQQREALEAVARLLPVGGRPVLMGDRFYGTPALIGWCRQRGWGWRLRVKQDLLGFEGGGETPPPGGPAPGGAPPWGVPAGGGGAGWGTPGCPNDEPSPTSRGCTSRATPSLGSSRCRSRRP